jgi:hypothetical protein
MSCVSSASKAARSESDGREGSTIPGRARGGVVEDVSTSKPYDAFADAVIAHFTGENVGNAKNAISRYYFNLKEPFTGRYF